MQSTPELPPEAASTGIQIRGTGPAPAVDHTASAANHACWPEGARAVAAFERQLRDAVAVEVPADLAASLLSVPRGAPG